MHTSAQNAVGAQFEILSGEIEQAKDLVANYFEMARDRKSAATHQDRLMTAIRASYDLANFLLAVWRDLYGGPASTTRVEPDFSTGGVHLEDTWGPYDLDREIALFDQRRGGVWRPWF